MIVLMRMVPTFRVVVTLLAFAMATVQSAQGWEPIARRIPPVGIELPDTVKRTTVERLPDVTASD